MPTHNLHITLRLLLCLQGENCHLLFTNKETEMQRFAKGHLVGILTQVSLLAAKGCGLTQHNYPA